MPISFKTKLNLKKLPSDIDEYFDKEMKDEFADAIIDEITSGKSPARGATFEEYSDSYSKKKGRKKPVDLLDSGKMLESIYVDTGPRKGVKVGFKSSIAEYHQDGTNKMPARKLLPEKRGFNVKLTKLLNKLLNKAVKKSLKKQ